MKKFLTGLLILLPMLLSADTISQHQAQKIAERFFNRSASLSLQSVSQVKMVWNSESGRQHLSEVQHPAYYVFNNADDRGFVIVSGDECTTSPILGYSFEDSFRPDDIPAGFQVWFDGIRSDILTARREHQVQQFSAARVPETFGYNDREPIVLLETALWDQRAPYNSKLPMGWVTGCPATAISIIMRYHEWPDKGVGTIPKYRDELPAIQLGHTYDWKNMPLNYNGASAEQNEQVAVLMRDVGAMIRTEYRGGSAGARPEETLPQLMPIYMRYNKSTIKSLFKRDVEEAEWHRLLQKELDEKRPVLYGGYSSGGGHQFVLDGYAAGNYYHVNWGWSGVSNGYYLLTVMNPPEQGAGGSMSPDGFTMKQDAIIGIQPDPDNAGGGFYDLIAYKPENPKLAYGMKTTATEFTQGQTFEVDLVEFQNKGSRDFRGEIALGHFSADGRFKGIVSERQIKYGSYPIAINESTFTWPAFKCTIKEPIEAGDKVCGVFKFQNPSDWTIIHNGYPLNDKCVEEILLKAGGTAPEPVLPDDLDERVGIRFDKVAQKVIFLLRDEDQVKVKVVAPDGSEIPAQKIHAVQGGQSLDISGLKGTYKVQFESKIRGNYSFNLKF